jgi:hypothetical protein
MGIFRERPSGSLGDNANGGPPTRANWYGDAIVQPMGGGNWGLADEGSYFVASNPTVGTGIAGHAAPVVADTHTKALFHLYNSGPRNIVMDYIWLHITAIGTAGTTHYTSVYIDDAGATARSSGGTAFTAVNVNSGSSNASSAVMWFGPVVTAMGTPRFVGSQVVREVVPVAGDTLRVNFGSDAPVPTAVVSGTLTARVSQNFPPVVIGPGGNFVFAQIRPSQSAAASYTFQVGFWER